MRTARGSHGVIGDERLPPRGFEGFWIERFHGWIADEIGTMGRDEGQEEENWKMWRWHFWSGLRKWIVVPTPDVAELDEVWEMAHESKI